jgi:hypothetical protein
MDVFNFEFLIFVFLSEIALKTLSNVRSLGSFCANDDELCCRLFIATEMADKELSTFALENVWNKFGMGISKFKFFCIFLCYPRMNKK